MTNGPDDAPSTSTPHMHINNEVRVSPDPPPTDLLSHGGTIVGVTPNGPADRAGVQQGDRLLAINGVAPRDLIDVRYETQAQDDLQFLLVRSGMLLGVTLSPPLESDIGVEWEQPTFDGLRECNNRCEFCFIRGVPRGLRRSLYVRDDDYRYSFLFGTFLTLTNLSEDDWRRIEYQRLSPLRVSVHATDANIRGRLLGRSEPAPIVPQLRRIGAAGVKVHAQVVLCPGLNDGKVLDQTIGDLADLAEVVESVAVVPVGVSDHLRLREIRALTREDAEKALRVVSRWHRTLRRGLGRGFVYPSDELFQMGGHSIPAARFYDGFPQLQNGVGLTRAMLLDWKYARRSLPTALPHRRSVVWLCGSAAQPALSAMADDARGVANLEILVRAVTNTLFGSAIGVSGLMSGHDAVEVLKALDVDRAVLPRAAFSHQGDRTLDEWTPEAIERESGVHLVLASSASELLNASVC